MTERRASTMTEHTNTRKQASIDTSKNKTTAATTTSTTNSTQQLSSNKAPSLPSPQSPTQLRQAARCNLTPQYASSSILSQKCCRRREASRPPDRAPDLLDDRAHQHAHANIDKQNNSNSNNSNGNDRHHIAAQLYGTQATNVPTPNPTTTTQLAGGKRSNDGYQP